MFAGIHTFVILLIDSVSFCPFGLDFNFAFEFRLTDELWTKVSTWWRTSYANTRVYSVDGNALQAFYKNARKLKEFNLFHDTPNGSWERSIKLRQIEILDELSFATYQASKKKIEQNPKRSDKRSRDKNRKDGNRSSGKKSKLKCDYCKNSGTPRKNALSKTLNSVRN